jgi:hypothetical protein
VPSASVVLLLAAIAVVRELSRRPAKPRA